MEEGYGTHTTNNNALSIDIESKQDYVSLQVAMRAVPGADREEIVTGQERLSLDVENVANFISLWASGFEWDYAAIMRGMDEFVPHAYQHTSMFAGKHEAL